MELSEYEQRIGKSRHIEVKIVCGYCEQGFWAKWSRVKNGLGKFCSRNCASLWQANQLGKKYVGKENGKQSFDNNKQVYYVYWFDPDTLQRKTTSYARWYWEINKGEIPEGYRASYRDGNALNLDPDNIVLISKEEFGDAISKRLIGHTYSEETLKKMSEAKKGKTLSEEQKEKIGAATTKMWKDGVFDRPETRKKYSEQGKSTKGNKRTEEQKRRMSLERVERYKNPEALEKLISSVSRGIDHPNWRGGVSKEKYPPEFSKRLRELIRKRDKNKCRICGKFATRYSGRVHHINANKYDNSEGNLLLVCNTCHGKIHASYATDDLVIMAFRSMLDY